MPSTRRKTRAILLGVAVVAVVAGAAYVVGPRLVGGTTSDSSSGSASATSTASASAAGGAAGGSGQAAEAATTSTAPYTIKAEPSKVATDAPLSTDGGSVTVTLTHAGFDQSSGTVQVYGFVAGVLEDGGTCTLTLTRGSDKVTASTDGAADATTTSCGLVQSPAGLAAGTWEAVLKYSSHDAHGTSPSVKVTVR